MKNRLCNFCTRYQVCKYRETLVELSVEAAVDWMDKNSYRRWLDHFAKYCMYFELDEITIDSLMPDLITIFYDPVRKEESQEDG